MKYLLFAVATLFAIMGIFMVQKSKIVFKQPMIQQTSPKASVQSSDYDVTMQNHSFSIYWQQIDPKGLTLVPNFDEKKTASQIMEENGCSYGANGGFYTTDYKPIGLFIADGTKFSSAVTNRTFNGFIVKDQNTISIQSSPPNRNVDFAVQSGPYMTPVTNLAIRDDSLARRVLVARTNNYQWYFIAITEKDNSFSGPLLADIPGILRKLPIDITEALNLDGGSASVFYSEDDVRLGELTPIGSFFCGF